MHILNVASNNASFPLSDGTSLFIVTGLYQDRTGATHDGGIEPDQAVDPSAPAVHERSATLAAALDWLAGQGACAA